MKGSLAIGERVAAGHAGPWPEDAAARAVARAGPGGEAGRALSTLCRPGMRAREAAGRAEARPADHVGLLSPAAW